MILLRGKGFGLSWETETEEDVQTEDNLVQEILDQFSKLEKDEDILYVFQNLFHILTHQMKALNIIQAFQTLDLNEETMFYHFLMNKKSRIEHLLELVQYQESEVQNTFYETLGGFLNKPLYHAINKLFYFIYYIITT